VTSVPLLKSPVISSLCTVYRAAASKLLGREELNGVVIRFAKRRVGEGLVSFSKS
jgi:hypothetical protein